jgi:hypothetical protein
MIPENRTAVGVTLTNGLPQVEDLFAGHDPVTTGMAAVRQFNSVTVPALIPAATMMSGTVPRTERRLRVVGVPPDGRSQSLPTSLSGSRRLQLNRRSVRYGPRMPSTGPSSCRVLYFADQVPLTMRVFARPCATEHPRVA